MLKAVSSEPVFRCLRNYFSGFFQSMIHSLGTNILAKQPVIRYLLFHVLALTVQIIHTAGKVLITVKQLVVFALQIYKLRVQFQKQLAEAIHDGHDPGAVVPGRFRRIGSREPFIGGTNILGSIPLGILDATGQGLMTADIVSPVADVQMQLEDVMNHKGTDEEKQARMFLTSLGIDYDELTPEEFVTMINILKKSSHLKSTNNQRGKGGLYPTHWKGNRKRKK